MYRIRFHGRGGQGMKTASRVLRTAFFLAGYEVQDAPRYGAERRGAPIFAYVRAARTPINERGVIPDPDLVLLADETLAGVPAADVTQGLDAHAVLVMNSAEAPETWRERLGTEARVIVLPPFSADDPAERPYVGSVMAGAAARLLGLPPDALRDAVAQELAGQGDKVVSANQKKAAAAFASMVAHEGIVGERDDRQPPADPGWTNPGPGGSRPRPAGHPRCRHQRPDQDRSVADAQAGGRPGVAQPLHLGLRILLPGRCHRRRCRRLSGHRLRPLQGLPDLPGAMPNARHPRRSGTGRDAMTSRRLLTGNVAAAWGARLAGAEYFPVFPITPQTEIIKTIGHWIDAQEMDGRMVTLDSEHSMLTAAGAAALTGGTDLHGDVLAGAALRHGDALQSGGLAGAVPTMFIDELEQADFAAYDLTSLRTGIMAGAPCPEALMKRVMDDMHCAEILIGYGQTEASPLTHLTDATDGIELRTQTPEVQDARGGGGTGRRGRQIDVR